jgi:hypothetical protein
MPCSLPRWWNRCIFGFFPVPVAFPTLSMGRLAFPVLSGSASTTSLSRPAQASLTLRPIRWFAHLKWTLSRGSSPVGYTLPNCSSATEPCRWLLGWVLPPLVICPSGHAIERGRTSRRRRVSILALSVCKVGSQFHHSHVSRGPPIIPDGRISQVRFEVLACRQ